MKAHILAAVILAGTTTAFAQFGPRPGDSRVHAGQQHRFFPGAFPWFLGDYDYGYENYTPAPNIVVVEQPPLYVRLPTEPSVPPKSEIHEYHQTGARDQEQTFAIVLKDGSVLSAAAVTAQNRGLYFVEPGGAHRLVALDAVDREATERLNRERKLQLQLPPAQ